jgi:hypothetical protein
VSILFAAMVEQVLHTESVEEGPGPQNFAQKRILLPVHRAKLADVHEENGGYAPVAPDEIRDQPARLGLQPLEGVLV